MLSLVLGWTLAVSCMGFLIGAMKLEADAMKHLKNLDRPTFGRFPMFSPEAFTPEGEPLRRRVLRYYSVGSSILVALAILTWILHESGL